MPTLVSSGASDDGGGESHHHRAVAVSPGVEGCAANGHIGVTASRSADSGSFASQDVTVAFVATRCS